VTLASPRTRCARERWLAGVLTQHPTGISGRAETARAVRVALAVACLFAAGCAGVKPAQQHELAPNPPRAAPAADSVPPAMPGADAEITPADVEAPPPVLEASAQPSPIEPVLAPRPAPAVRAPAPHKPSPTRTVNQTAAVQPPAVVASAPVPAVQASKAAAPSPAASKPPEPPLDLKSLETRLRQTKAIGVLTKLSLKNQVDDLVSSFRAYHKRQATTTLAELRHSYDMLLLKVLSLLQDSDPPLARDIIKSRAAIWSILADPKKFTESNLMAGATP